MDKAAADRVEQLRAGDEDAWKEFIRSHGRLIYAAGRRAGLGQSDLDEAFQATCVEVYKAIGSLRDPTKLTSWLYSIAFRSAVNLRRVKSREVSIEGTEEGSLLDWIPSGEPSPDDLLVQIDQAGRLYSGLERLDLRCRKLIEALYLHVPKVSYQEISKLFRLPIGSIGPTRARCLEKLKTAFLDVSGADPPDTNRQGRPERG